MKVTRRNLLKQGGVVVATVAFGRQALASAAAATVSRAESAYARLFTIVNNAPGSVTAGVQVAAPAQALVVSSAQTATSSDAVASASSAGSPQGVPSLEAASSLGNTDNPSIAALLADLDDRVGLTSSSPKGERPVGEIQATLESWVMLSFPDIPDAPALTPATKPGEDLLPVLTAAIEAGIKAGYATQSPPSPPKPDLPLPERGSDAFYKIALAADAIALATRPTLPYELGSVSAAI